MKDSLKKYLLWFKIWLFNSQICSDLADFYKKISLFTLWWPQSGFTGRSRPVIRKFVQYLRYFRLTSNLERGKIIELANHWPSFKNITQIYNLCDFWKLFSSLSVMAHLVKWSLVEEYDSNDSDFSLKLMKKTTDGMNIE